MEDDYYALLGVAQGVSHTELRRAWRRLALQWHPDRSGEQSAATFRKIQSAYAVLADPISRAAYDRRHARTAERRGRTPAVMLERISGPINGLLACGIVSMAGNDILDLHLNANEAATGGMVTIAMRVPVTCAACAASPQTACSRCAGKRVAEELFSAWLAVPAGVHDGEILPPSALLPGMKRRVLFRARLAVT